MNEIYRDSALNKAAFEIDKEKRSPNSSNIDGSWSAIVDLIFDIVSHRDQLALKCKAIGRHKRKLARQNRKCRGRP